VPVSQRRWVALSASGRPLATAMAVNDSHENTLDCMLFLKRDSFMEEGTGRGSVNRGQLTVNPKATAGV